MKPSPYYDRVVDVMEELLQVHAARPRPERLSHRPLQRASRGWLEGRDQAQALAAAAMSCEKV